MTYLGYPVLDWAVAIDSVSLSVRAKTNIIGKVYQNRRINVQQKPYSYLKFTFKQDDNEERKQLRDFFIQLKGRLSSFFVRSYKNDLKLIKDAAVNDNVLYVRQGYDENAVDIHTQYLYMEGHPTPYKIEGMAAGYDPELDIETVAVTISPPLPIALEKSCAVMEFMYFGRFDSDTLTFDYDDIKLSTSSLSFREASDAEIAEKLS